MNETNTYTGCVGLFYPGGSRAFPCSACVKAARHLQYLEGGQRCEYMAPSACAGSCPEFPEDLTALPHFERRLVENFRRRQQALPEGKTMPALYKPQPKPQKAVHHEPVSETTIVVCARCGQPKYARDFYPCASKSNGLSSYCRECTVAKRRERRQKQKSKKI